MKFTIKNKKYRDILFCRCVLLASASNNLEGCFANSNWRYHRINCQNRMFEPIERLVPKTDGNRC